MQNQQKHGHWARKINGKTEMKLFGSLEVPVNMDIVYINNASLPFILPKPGLHLTLQHTMSTLINKNSKSRTRVSIQGVSSTFSPRTRFTFTDG
jgi:hypothetical protein